jgi:hypothetical protein
MKACKQISLMIALLSILGFLLISCENLFSRQREIPVSTGKLILSLGDDSSRTIYPDAPEFIGYRLEFANSDSGVEIPDPVSVDQSIAEVNLPEGTWTVTVYGIASFNGASADVAEGSAEVVVTANNVTRASIPISSGISGGNGKFDWSLSVPAGIEVDTWSVKMVSYQAFLSGTTDSVIDTGDTFDSEEAVSVSDSIICPSGYYVFLVQVGNAGQSATRMEIVLIHSGLTTTADYSFSAADFVKLIQLSGTLEVTTSDDSRQTFLSCTIEVHTDNANGGLASAKVDSDGNWVLYVEPCDESTSVYFTVSGQTTDNVFVEYLFPSDLTIDDINVENIKLETQVIKLNGTVHITENDTLLVFDSYCLTAHSENSGLYSGGVQSDSDGNWKMYVQSRDVPVPVYFFFSGETTDGQSIGFNIFGDWMLGKDDIRDMILEKAITQVEIRGTFIPADIGESEEARYYLIIASTSSSYMVAYMNNSAEELSYIGTHDEEGNWSVTVQNGRDYYIHVLEYSNTSQRAFVLTQLCSIGEESLDDVDLVLSGPDLNMEQTSWSVSGTIINLPEGVEWYELWCGSLDMLETNDIFGNTDMSDCSLPWVLMVPRAEQAYEACFYLEDKDGLFITTSTYLVGSEDKDGIVLDFASMVPASLY